MASKKILNMQSLRCKKSEIMYALEEKTGNYSLNLCREEFSKHIYKKEAIEEI